jgi:quinoprotein glucose dehydrogenase
MFLKTVLINILLLILIPGIMILNCIQVSASPVQGDTPQKVMDSFLPDPQEYNVETWADDLDIPWALIFLAEDRALVTERAGSIRLVERGQLHEKPYKVIEGVSHAGEGGLMGLAKHPEYPEVPCIYVMYTYQGTGGLFNRVARYLDNGETLDLDRILIDRIPGHRVHNGGRIAFGPDRILRITRVH